MADTHETCIPIVEHLQTLVKHERELRDMESQKNGLALELASKITETKLLSLKETYDRSLKLLYVGLGIVLALQFYLLRHQ